MKFGSTALSSIILNSFEGKKNNLALAAGCLPNVITKLTSGQFFTPQTLSLICGALTEEDARTLCAAACRDYLPKEFHTILSAAKSKPNQRTFPPVDEKTKSIIFDLAELCSRDTGAQEWLHQMATWIFKEWLPLFGPSNAGKISGAFLAVCPPSTRHPPQTLIYIYIYPFPPLFRVLFNP